MDRRESPALCLVRPTGFHLHRLILNRRTVEVNDTFIGESVPAVRFVYGAFLDFKHVLISDKPKRHVDARATGRARDERGMMAEREQKRYRAAPTRPLHPPLELSFSSPSPLSPLSYPRRRRPSFSLAAGRRCALYHPPLCLATFAAHSWPRIPHRRERNRSAPEFSARFCRPS